MSERRKTKRRYSILRATFIVDNDPSRYAYEALVTNISPDGLMLKGIPKAIAISTILDVKVHSPRVLEPISLKGKIVRIEEEASSYNYGLSFAFIKEQDKKLIEKWGDVETVDKILNEAVKLSASDVHLVAGQPVTFRIHGELQRIDETVLSAEEVKTLVWNIMNERQREQFEDNLELDMLYVNDAGRFRVNVHQEKGQLGAVMRYIPTEVRTLKDWELPAVLRDLALKQNGLILVTGPVGSGKSTTLAAMIDVINQEKKKSIVSLEEPIEYLYQAKKSLIIQREVGLDTHSFLAALKHVVRQDPDVVLIGELRNLESVAFAISAAETGALVLSTLPTIDVTSTINRVVDVFPPSQHDYIRLRLSEVLRGIVSQRLVKRRDKPGRAAATEIFVNTPASSNIIRKGSLEDIRSIIETGSRFGMHTMASSLESLYNRGVISTETYEIHMKSLDRK